MSEEIIKTVISNSPSIAVLFCILGSIAFAARILKSDSIERCFWTSYEMVMYIVFYTIMITILLAIASGVYLGVIMTNYVGILNLKIVSEVIANLIIIIAVLNIIRLAVSKISFIPKILKTKFSAELIAKSYIIMIVTSAIYASGKAMVENKIDSSPIGAILFIFACIISSIKFTYIKTKKFYVYLEEDNVKWYIQKGLTKKKVLLIHDNMFRIKNREDIEGMQIIEEKDLDEENVTNI